MDTLAVVADLAVGAGAWAAVWQLRRICSALVARLDDHEHRLVRVERRVGFRMPEPVDTDN